MERSQHWKGSFSGWAGALCIPGLEKVVHETPDQKVAGESDFNYRGKLRIRGRYILMHLTVP